MPSFNEKYQTPLKDISITNRMEYLDIEKYFKKVSVQRSIPKNRVFPELEEDIKVDLLSQLVGELMKSDSIHLEKYVDYDIGVGSVEKYRISLDILDTKAMRKNLTSSEFI